MLRDRYDRMNIFELIPALSSAMDPVLTQLDHLLDDDPLFRTVKADLAKRYPQTLVNGRRSTPVEVILRMLVVKHLYDWSYEETEHWVADSLVLRQFCRVYTHPVPDDTTLSRWALLIQPATLHTLLDRVSALARQLKVTRGRKLRVDSTVVETNICYPTDSRLLADGVRVVSRLLKQSRTVVGEAAGNVGDAFRSRTRSAQQHLQRIYKAVRQRGEEAGQRVVRAYRDLVRVTQASLEQMQRVRRVLEHSTSDQAGNLRRQMDHFQDLIKKVIDQTRQRVFDGKTVPADDKVTSLFEPHTAIIRRGRIGQPVEFGRKVWLGEVEGGIVSEYRILQGNPPDSEPVLESLAHHCTIFGKPPGLLAGDRGTSSPENESQAKAQGVKSVVLPQKGGKSQERQEYERQHWFRAGRRWRTGIEGRISVLKRRHGLDRCLYHGENGMERWVGWGIIAHDLRQIALATTG